MCSPLGYEKIRRNFFKKSVDLLFFVWYYIFRSPDKDEWGAVNLEN